MTTYLKWSEVPIKIRRGDSESYTFTIQDSAGDALDLSGLTITCQGRYDADDRETLWDVTLTDGINGNDFQNGILVLKIPAADTARLTTSGVFDIAASNELTYVSGNFTVLKDVTR